MKHTLDSQGGEGLRSGPLTLPCAPACQAGSAMSGRLVALFPLGLRWTPLSLCLPPVFPLLPSSTLILVPRSFRPQDQPLASASVSSPAPTTRGDVQQTLGIGSPQEDRGRTGKVHVLPDSRKPQPSARKIGSLPGRALALSAP